MLGTGDTFGVYCSAIIIQPTDRRAQSPAPHQPELAERRHSAATLFFVLESFADFKKASLDPTHDLLIDD